MTSGIFLRFTGPFERHPHSVMYAPLLSDEDYNGDYAFVLQSM